MGEAVPLSLFKTADEGLKMFTDENCRYEEKLDETNTIQKTYIVDIPNIIRGKKKFTTRYIKNCGNEKLLYAVFPTTEEGLNVTFKLDGATIEKETASGLLISSGVHKLDIYVDVPNIGETPSLYLGIATRAILNKTM